MGVDEMITTKVLFPLASSPSLESLVPVVQKRCTKATRQATGAILIWWIVVIPVATVSIVLLPLRDNMASAWDALSQFMFLELVLRFPIPVAGLIVMIVASVQVRGLIVRWQVTKCLDGLTTSDNASDIAPIRAATAIGVAEMSFKVSGILLAVVLVAGGLLWAFGFYMAAQAALLGYSSSGSGKSL